MFSIHGKDIKYQLNSVLNRNNMEQSEKYYNPKIEEFYTGFEYEAIVGQTPDNKPYYAKRIYEIGNCITNSVLEPVGKLIRVKYLDQQDIEKCGWTFFGSPMDKQGNKDYPMVFRIMEKKPKNPMHDWNEKAMLTILSHSVLQIIIDKQNFLITIRNKSELKVLMKQLGI